METRINGLENYYGALHVKKENGKFFIIVYCDVVDDKEWREISKELYDLLIALNNEKA